MPPAFVLSQDQTLKTIVSKHRSVQIKFFEFFMAQILTLTLVRYCKIFEKYILLKVITGSCLSLRCLIFKVLVISQELSLSRDDLFIISHFQAFVKSFLKLFLKFFRSAGFNQVRFLPRNPLLMRLLSSFCFALRATA